MFDKSAETFPIKKKSDFLGHCAISPLYRKAATAMKQYTQDMAEAGITGLPKYFPVMQRFRENVAQLLKTGPENISYVHNTAEALSMIANGYPFQEGDQVISYRHEYPSVHYPWVLQKERGVELVLLSDVSPEPQYSEIDRPTGWSMQELEGLVNEKTRLVVVSHVQFTSGFAADLEELGRFCTMKGIDLVVDCAQSLGCLPVFPEKYGLSAVVASSWKWLLGPMGSAILYTSKGFREKITVTLAGPNMMRQGLDYLDLRWNPHDDGRKFEYSSLPWDHIAGINGVLEDVFLRYSPEMIRDEVFRLQDRFLQKINRDKLLFLEFERQHRSGILAAEPFQKPEAIIKQAAERDIIITGPVGYLRFAPHFYNDDAQMDRVADCINALL